MIRHAQVRKYATREMLSIEGCKHAVYGIRYNGEHGTVEELANTTKEIVYFYTDEAFQSYVTNLRMKYNTFKNFNIYAVHREDYSGNSHLIS